MKVNKTAKKLLAQRFAIVSRRKYLNARSEYRHLYLARYHRKGQPMVTSEIMDAAHYVNYPTLPAPLSNSDWRIVEITVYEEYPE